MKCKDCKWWDVFADDEDKDTGAGYCHRNAPLPQHSENSSDISPEIVHSITESDDWCGEFEEKKKTE